MARARVGVRGDQVFANFGALPPSLEAAAGSCRFAPVTEQELMRWKSARYCYAPYQFKEEHLVRPGSQAQSQGLAPRTPTALEREALLDYPAGHTLTCRRTSARKGASHALEVCRCSLLGNGFQCATVAHLLAHWAVAAGYLKCVPPVSEMRLAGGRSSSSDLSFEPSLLGESPGAAEVCKHEAELGKRSPSVLLTEELVRRADPRGSDVRLDTGALLRPGIWPRQPVNTGQWTWRTVAACDWKSESHALELETRAALVSARWRFRSTFNLRRRLAHLMDNQSSLGIVTKCRSSSRKLNILCKRLAALVLAACIRIYHGYCETDRNPADKPTRAVALRE